MAREVQSGHFHGPTEVVGVALKVFRAVYGSPELYDAYVRAGIKEALDDPRPSIPGERVFAELEARIAARQVRTYTVELEPAEEGGYVVTCPALPGLAAQGKGTLEALAMAEDAIEAWLTGLLKDGQPLPPSDEPRAERVSAQVTVAVEPPR